MIYWILGAWILSGFISLFLLRDGEEFGLSSFVGISLIIIILGPIFWFPFLSDYLDKFKIKW